MGAMLYKSVAEADIRHAPRAGEALKPFHLVIAAMVAVAALLVVMASLRLTDEAVTRTVDEREAPARFLAEQLGTLRLVAMTSTSVVPARLYLGIEQCFRDRAPIPFDEGAARSTLGTCAELELGRLQAQGGARMAAEGKTVLGETLTEFASP